MALAGVAGRLRTGRLRGQPEGRRHPRSRSTTASTSRPPTSLVAAFEKQTGIHVNVRSNDEDVFANQIVQEGRGRRPTSSTRRTHRRSSTCRTKVCWRRSTRPPWPMSPPSTTRPRGTGSGVTARVSVMIYNTNLVKPDQLPTSVMQLADPQWKGKLALAAGETDFQPIVTSIVKAHGKAAALTWLEAVKTNAGSHIYPDNETITSMVNDGQAAIGIINHYYWYRRALRRGRRQHAFGHRLLRPR